MEMTALVSNGPNSPFSIETVTLDAPRPEEILVKMVATGLCHTDLFTKKAMPEAFGPWVFGHEGAGIVEAIGETITDVAVGDHVVLSFRHCNSCTQCNSAHPAYCLNATALNYSGGRLDGSTPITQGEKPIRSAFFGQSSFAQYALVTSDNVVVIDPEIDLALAAPFGCGIQTGAGAVLNILQPQTTDSLVIYGAGSVGFAGLLAGRSAKVSTIIAVDPVAQRRDLATKFGAIAIDPTTEDVVKRIKEITNGGATHALDTTGIPAVINQAVAALSKRGHLVVVGLGTTELTVNIQDIMLNGKVIQGCIEGDSTIRTFIPQLLTLLADGEFPVEELITRYPYAEINAAVADQHSGSSLKPVLIW